MGSSKLTSTDGCRGEADLERHIALDRAMWGSDQAASVETHGFERLVKYIRVVEQALGNGVKRVWPSEVPIMNKLRRIEGGSGG